MARIGSLAVYPGITPLLSSLHEQGEALAIVTKSPDMVAKGLCKLHDWPIENIVGYHQVKARKPDPEGLILAMQRVGARPEETLHVGDQPEDTQASRAAGVTAIGSAWGLLDVQALRESKPDYLFSSVEELAALLKAR